MNKSILIVEDQEEISKYLKEILIDHDYIVRIANNGASGLKIINTILPDLVLLDLGLPDIDGETVCREIKKYWVMDYQNIMPVGITPSNMVIWTLM